ncbi:MAG: sigma-54-dependent Fis family transcriptional regulator [Deltaproteobacteria bacterium]|nr:sigma-54-dependent Fis family transcriptional regulator [Deltaproteobacteria bacterium]MBW2070567.1 sigma-54-dependent Fis family transcriptional regulator [Deltaproteobacteria bacterium]
MVDDESVVRTGIGRILERQGLPYYTAANGNEALSLLAKDKVGIVLLDVMMPGMNGIEVLKRIRASYPDTVVIMITGHPTIDSAVQCTRLGAMDYLVKPFRVDELEALISRAQECLGASQDCGSAVHLQDTAAEVPYIVGNSPAIRQVFAKIKKAAPSHSTVLVTGESGTGKELVARAIHALSDRADREFVPVDCSALVESLLESELFGHVKGSFTGAYQTKHGLFELANHGTFFFDEISNLSLNIQAKLLRVIQEREFMKVGSQKRIKLDIRIIASSNRDLREAIHDGTFREDLFYRLSVVPIHLPPLRERTGDIPLLVDHFLDLYSKRSNRKVEGISKAALEMLTSYAWPGNVRELEHTIERILILEDCEIIQPEHLPSFITQRQGEFQVFSEENFTLEEIEKRYIQFILRRTKGKRQQAARILGINRKTLAAKIKRYDLRVNW